MKVWYILMIFPSPSETFVATDVKALRRLGVEVSVHALRGPRRDAERLLRERDLDALEVTHATVRSVLRGLFVALSQPVLTARVVTWIVQQSGGNVIHLGKGIIVLPRVFDLFARLERERPDVVHLYWGHYPSIFGWLVRERMPGITVSLSLSAYDLLRGFRGSADVGRRAHVVSTWAAANIPIIAARGIPSEQVHLSWQGVDLEKIRHLSCDKIAHRVVTAGRLVVEKGMDDVLRAFAELRGAYSDASLVVLGDGPDRRRVEELATSLGVREAVTFRGHVAHDEVFAELARAELFLFLSRYAAERLPNVVKEAMACRCVVVTSATSGIDELMTDGEHGWIVPQGAWEQAAARAIKVFADPYVATQTAAAAQSRVFDRFDVLTQMAGMRRKWEECGASPRVKNLRGRVNAPDHLVASIEGAE